MCRVDLRVGNLCSGDGSASLAWCFSDAYDTYLRSRTDAKIHTNSEKWKGCYSFCAQVCVRTLNGNGKMIESPRQIVLAL